MRKTERVYVCVRIWICMYMRVHARTCEEIHVLQAGGIFLFEASEGCLELQFGDLACHVPHLIEREGVPGAAGQFAA